MHAPVSQLRGSCALGLRVQHRQLRQAPVSKPGVVAVPLVVRFARGDGIGHVLQRARVFCVVAVLDAALRIAPLRILSVCRACTDAQDNGAEERSRAPVTAVFSVECVHMPDDITAPAARAATQSPALIDIGINLAHDSYDADRDAVIARAEAAGVAQMIVTGASLAGSAQASALSRAHPGRLFATAGVHPHHAAELDRSALGELEELARAPGGRRGRRMWPRLLPRLLPARRAAAGVPPPAGTRRSGSASRCSCTSAMHTMTSSPSCASTARAGAASRTASPAMRHELAGLPGARPCHRHHRLDLR